MVIPEEHTFYLVAFLTSAVPSSTGTDGLEHILIRNKRILNSVKQPILGSSNIYRITPNKKNGRPTLVHTGKNLCKENLLMTLWQYLLQDKEYFKRQYPSHNSRHLLLNKRPLRHVGKCVNLTHMSLLMFYHKEAKGVRKGKFFFRLKLNYSCKRDWNKTSPQEDVNTNYCQIWLIICSFNPVSKTRRNIIFPMNTYNKFNTYTNIRLR